MPGYNLIVKARDVYDAQEAVDGWLSLPRKTAISMASLGYNEVIVSVTLDEDLTDVLNEWMNETRPRDGGPFGDGSLIWWKS